jgi:hypothetical protein
LVPERCIDLESKRSHRDVDTAAGERQLDCASRVTKLPAANLETIQMLVAPPDSDLQCSVELGQRRLFGDQEPASDRRRHAT